MKDFLKYISENIVLKAAVQYIVEYNEYSSYNPYHNIKHLFSVSKMCYEICLSEELYDDLETIVLAGLFHDTLHYGGTIECVKDVDNIESSLGFFKYFNDNVYSVNNFSLVQDLIKCTEFPYTRTNADCTLLEKIIRDADMCSVLEEDFIFPTIFGLAKEFGVTIKAQVLNQINFVSKLNFSTNYCINKWIKVKNKKLEEINILNNILNG